MHAVNTTIQVIFAISGQAEQLRMRWFGLCVCVCVYKNASLKNKLF